MDHSIKTAESIDFLVQENVSRDVSERIELGLSQHEEGFFQAEAKNKFVLAYKKNDLVGGLRSVCKDKDYYIKHLWVEESIRGIGLGAALVNKAEKEAANNKCDFIWVDTMSYQAPQFYKNMGYKEIACVKNYRGKHDRIFFRKDV
jgi:ribosomal protein S18 acetylase RimI-like enzyme